jgi:mRNA interferase RelE/StbE
LVWKIEWVEESAKEFRKLDKVAQQKIRNYLVKRIAVSDDPTQFGKPLKRHLSGLWRYRVGDYRIICQIRKEEIMVLVVRVSHRKNVYQ